MVSGALGGGAFGMRVSKPGYDVMTEPFGSATISFDTRFSDIGTVIAGGLIQCGAGPVPFPGGALPYVPIAHILRWDGSNIYSDHVVIRAVSHQWLPAVAIVTASSIEVRAFTNPWVNTLAYFNPNGTYFVYYVFASG
jgi:hypothetical protein